MAEGEVDAVLIDCSSVIFVDVAGARLFIQVSRTLLFRRPSILTWKMYYVYGTYILPQMCMECQKIGVGIYLANCNGEFSHILYSPA